ncbi:hypothetical protein [Acinetobacter soli]|uniref:hypothetical protein n=1 Tax=Acinetobacter soli TaxID=487316 RepID=UPI000CE56200|nr:hypothetical protein [Acinetobacter soli]PPB87769.1 hypothetical protein AsoHEU7_03550 [Acinetobacter soli]
MMPIQIQDIKAKTQTAANALIKDAVNANRDDFTVFVDFAGHVNHLTIEVYPGGFDTKNNARLKNPIFYGYLKPFPCDLKDIKEWQKILTNLLEARKNLNKLVAEESKKLWESS